MVAATGGEWNVAAQSVVPLGVDLVGITSAGALVLLVRRRIGALSGNGGQR